MKIYKKLVLLLPILFLLVSFAACNQESNPPVVGQEHKHTFSSEWDYDAKSHWHNSTCEHKELTSDFAPHDFGSWKISKEDDTIEERICFNCSYIEKRSVSSEHIHDYGKWKVTEEPTLEMTGLLVRICSTNEEHVEEHILPMLNSKDYTYSLAIASTCTTQGKGVYTYIIDEQSFDFDFDLPLSACKYGDWKVVKAPTKENAGQLKRECSINEEHIDVFELPALDNISYTVTLISSSCLVSGKESYTIRKDEQIFTFEIILPATDHAYESAYDSSKHWSQAICEHSTLKKEVEDHIIVNGICKVCGYEEIENLSVLYTLNSSEDGYIAAFNPEYTGNSILFLDTFLDLPVTELHASSFNGENIKFITIPSSIKKIEANVFESFSQLQDVYYDGSIQDWCLVEFEDKTSNPMYHASSFYQRGQVYWEETTALNIPAEISVINSFQFYGFEHMKEIHLPSTIRQIFDEAFANCIGITEFVLPDSILFLGKSILANTNIEKLTLPFLDSSHPYIGYYFGATSVSNQDKVTASLREITVTKAKTLGDYAFYKLSNLRSLTLPESLLELGKKILSSCESLNYTEYQNGYYLGSKDNPYLLFVQMIDKEASSFELASETKFIYDEAFKNAKITEIELPEDLIEIEESAFYQSLLTKIVIPDGIKKIKENTFYNCANLEEVVLPADLTNIVTLSYSSAFGGTHIKRAQLALGAIDILSSADLEELTLLKGEGSINLASYPNLQKVILTNGISSIGSGIMEACIKLEYHMENNLAYLGSLENPYLFLIKAIDKAVEQVAIHDNTLYLYEEAFMDCTYLESVYIPYGVLSIGDSAFKNCVQLLSIDIPYSVTFIGKEVFMNDTNLQYVSLSSSLSRLEALGSYAFAYCSSLRTLTLPDHLIEVGYYILRGCSSLTSLSVPFVGRTSNPSSSSSTTLFGYFFGNYSFDGGVRIYQSYSSSLTVSQRVTAYLPATLKNVVVRGGNLFYGTFNNCSMIESINIYEEVTCSGSSIFSGCAFKEVRIPGTFLKYSSEIANRAEKIIITSGETLPFSTFSSFSALKEVELPDTMTNIGSSAFRNCSNLTTIKLPAQLEGIENSAFSGCSSLRNIDLPATIKSIGAQAFYQCTSLKYIFLPKGLEILEYQVFYQNVNQAICLEAAAVPEGWASNWNLNTSAQIHYNVKSVVEGKDVYYILKDSSAWVGGSVLDDPKEIEIQSEIIYEDIVYPVQIEKGIFHLENQIEKIILPFIGENKNSINSSDSTPFGYIFGASTIEDNASYVPSSLTTIILTGGNSIPKDCFSNLTQIKEVVLQGDILSVGIYAFHNCSSLESVVFSNQTKTISAGVFHGCTSLKYIIVPNSLETFNDNAFDASVPIIDIYYEGTEEEWDTISGKQGYIRRLNIYYYSEANLGEKYWHYVEGIPTLWTENTSN